MNELQYLFGYMYVYVICLIGITIGALGSYYLARLFKIDKWFERIGMENEDDI